MTPPPVASPPSTPQPSPGQRPSGRPTDGRPRFGSPSRKATRKPKPSGRSIGAAISGQAATGSAQPAAQRSDLRGQVASSIRRDEVAAREAQLVVSKVEPWSVTRLTFCIATVAWIGLIVAVAVLYSLLSVLGVFHSLEQVVSLTTATKNSAGSSAASWFSAKTILEFTVVIGAAGVILSTALATLGTVFYNLISRWSGGIEITLQEAD
jgi:hypothetical protein